MVSLSAVKASNSSISNSLPPGLVGVFVGATNGIGEATVKQFAKYAQNPRAYLVGRSQEAGDRIVKECQNLNPGGQYIFIKADVSLLRVVDEVCREIQGKERVVNILFLSAGVLDFSKSTFAIYSFPLTKQDSRASFAHIPRVMVLITISQGRRRDWH